MFFYLLTITNPKGVYRWIIWRRENLARLLETCACASNNIGVSYTIKPIHHTPKNIRSWAPPEVHWFDSPRWS